MKKKDSKVDRKRIEKKNDKVESELKEENEHPENIIRDEIRYDKKHPHEEPENPELDKKSKKIMLFAILGAALIVAGIITFTQLIDVEERAYDYNGFTFEKYPGAETWYTSVRVNDKIYPLPFHHGPKEIEDISYEVDKNKLLSSDFIYLSMPPMDDKSDTEARRIGLAAVEVGKIIGTRNNIFNIPAKATLTHLPEGEEIPETEDGETIPVVNCENLPDNSTAVIFRIGSFTSVYEESDNCYIVQGSDGRETVKAADRLAYGLLGIMQ
ncbi:MAG: hypothetical protein ACLFTR_05070 [Candidatus Woesearchaeota archaeon]